MVECVEFQRNCFDKFKEFKRLQETQSYTKSKIFGLRITFNKFLKDYGIEKQTCTLYMLQPDGVAERANRTIGDGKRHAS